MASKPFVSSLSSVSLRLARALAPDLRRATRNSVFIDLSLITLIGFALFITIALFSFTPGDNTYFAATWPPANKTGNLGGSVGAGLASFLFFFIGFASFLIPAVIALAATHGWISRQKATANQAMDNSIRLSRLTGVLILMAVTCAGLALWRSELDWRGFPMPTGGLAGQEIAAVVASTLGRAGGIIALGLLFVGALILVFNQPFLRAATDMIGDRLQERDAPEKPAPNATVTVDTSFVFHEDSHFDPETVEADVEGPDTPVDITPRAERSHPVAYNIPPTEIFQSSSRNKEAAASVPSQKDIEQTANLLVKTFADFGVSGKVIGYQPGPVVTVFEFQPDAGVKQSRVLGLIDDLALSLKVDSIFINPVPGKRALGVQVPNARRETVYLGDIIGSETFQGSPSPLVFAMGKSLSGQPVCADLTSMPHLLMAGATGAGKSVAINSLICSVVMKSSPADVRMILVDPKMLELSVYEGIPHLLMPVITEPDRASHALKWAAAEMERRYRLMQFAAVRNIAGFNQFLSQASPSRIEEIRVASGGGAVERLPYILLVIDELADLMLTAPKDVESSIQRLAQKARASGIHMVLATQRPSVDIITGVIKANLPCRLSFQVVSKHDSRTILDQVGAEKLLGRGDMLFQRPGSGRLERIQGALVGDEEVLGLVATLKASGAVAYDDSIMNWIDEELQRERAGEHDGLPGMDSEEDPKYSEAMQIAQSHGVVSASFLQRHLKIGYNRAARIVEHMERCGLVAKADGAKPRRWLGPSA